MLEGGNCQINHNLLHGDCQSNVSGQCGQGINALNGFESGIAEFYTLDAIALVSHNSCGGCIALRQRILSGY